MGNNGNLTSEQVLNQLAVADNKISDLRSIVRATIKLIKEKDIEIEI